MMFAVISVQIAACHRQSLQHCIASRGLQCYINKHNTILLLKVSSIANMFRHLFIMVS